MKTKLLALVFMAGGAAMAGPRIFFGFGAPAPVVTAYVPPAPAPGYTWVAGYYAPVGPRWVWHTGYWARRPFAGAVWVGTRHYRGRYFGGYWRR